MLRRTRPACHEEPAENPPADFLCRNELDRWSAGSLSSLIVTLGRSAFDCRLEVGHLLKTKGLGQVLIFHRSESLSIRNARGQVSTRPILVLTLRRNAASSREASAGSSMINAGSTWREPQAFAGPKPDGRAFRDCAAG